MLAQYFKQLNQDLKQQGKATPQLIVDAAVLQQNIQQVQQQLAQAQHLQIKQIY